MSISAGRTIFRKISCASSGANEIIPAVTGKKLRVTAYSLVAAADVTVNWESGTTDISGVMSLPAKGGLSPQAPGGVLETAEGEALGLTLGSAVQVSGHLTYVLE